MANYDLGKATGEIELKLKTDDLDKAASSTDKVGAAGEKNAKRSSLAFQAAFIAIGTTIVAGGVAAVKGLYDIGDQFDSLVDGIRVGTGATGKELEGLKASAIAVGKAVPAEFQAVGETITQLNTRLGLSGDTLETVAAQYLEAGRILGTEVDIDQSTAAFSAFKIEGEDVIGAMDHLFRVSQSTGIEFNELTGIVQKAAPAMQELGFSFEDTAALAGTLDKAGLDSSKVMMGMSKAMVELAKDGEEPQAAFQRVVGEIENFIATGDRASAIELASKIFGTRGAPQMIAALESGVIGLDDMTAAAGLTSDTIIGVGEETADFAEKWQLVKNNAAAALEPLASAVFTALGDALIALAPSLESFALWLADNMWVLGAVAALIGTVLVIALGAFTAAVWASTVALLANPITWVVVGIVALIAALVMLVANWETVVSFITTIWGGFINWIIQITDGFFAWWNGVWAGFVEWIVGIWESIVSGVTGAWSGITEAVAGVWEGFVAWVMGALVAFMTWWNTVWTGITAIVSTVWNTIITIITTVLTSIIGFVAPILEALLAIFSRIWNAIYGVINAALNLILAIILFVWNSALMGMQIVLTAIFAVVTTIWNAIAAFMGPILAAIAAVISAVWNSILSVITTVLNAIISTVQSIWSAISSFISSVLAAISSTVSSVWNNIRSIVSSVMSSINSTITSIWNSIVSFISGVLANIVSSIVSGFNSAKSQAVSIVEGLRSGVENGFNNLMSFIGGIKDRIIGFFAGAGAWLLNAGAEIIGGLISGLEGALGGLQGFLEDVTSMIPDWKGPPKRDKVLLKPAGEMIMGSLVDGFDAEIDNVYETLNDLNANIPLTMDAVVNPNFTPFDDQMMRTGIPEPAPRDIVDTRRFDDREPNKTEITINGVPMNYVDEVSDALLFATRKIERGGGIYGGEEE